MAELINKKDSLNTGREKLNEAIKDSNKALTDSQRALLKAIESMNLSERTQKELTEAILEGDSSPLAGQLRVGADGEVYDGPQERLIAEYDRTNQQLADTVSYIERKELDIWDFVEYIPQHNALTPEYWDWTYAIQKALDKLSGLGSGKLVFPPGVYNHGGTVNKKPTSYSLDGTYDGFDRYRPDDGVGFEYYHDSDRDVYVPLGNRDIGEDMRLKAINLKNAEIVGYGAVIRSHKDNALIPNNAGLYFKDCENVTIKGLMYDGNKNERKPFMVDSGGFNFQHNIIVTGNSRNINFYDVHSPNSVMDGFNLHYASRPIENIGLYNCTANNCYRQGVTVGQIRSLNIVGGEYSDTGKTYGTRPMAGINIEIAEDNSYAEHVNIVGSAVFKNNIGSGVRLDKGTRHSTIENCYFENNGIYESQVNTLNNTIKNNTVINAEIESRSGGVQVLDNDIINKEVFMGEDYRPILRREYEGISFANARKSLIKGNTITVIDVPDSQPVEFYGGIKVNEGDIVEGNTFNNAVAENGSGLIDGLPSVVSHNTFNYNGSRNILGRIRGGSVETIGNKVDERYTIVPGFPSVFKGISPIGTNHFAMKSYLIQMKEDDCVDIIFEGIGYSHFAELLLVDSNGSMKEVVMYDSNVREALYGGLQYRYAVSGKYKKGDNYIITIRRIMGDDELGLHIKSYEGRLFDHSNIGISSIYPYRDADIELDKRALEKYARRSNPPTESAYTLKDGDSYLNISDNKVYFWINGGWRG